MARKHRIMANIDKLRVAYRNPCHIFNELAQYKKDDWIDFPDFQVHIIEKKSKHGSDDPAATINIAAQIILQPDGNQSVELGTLTMFDTESDNGLCFFQASNRALYTVDYDAGNFRYNWISELNWITDTLQLIPNSITELEIAIDTNSDVIPKLCKMARYFDCYDMIFNGTRLGDNERLRHLAFWVSGTRRNLFKIKEPYFSTAKGDVAIKMYDKTTEIRDNLNEKAYIEAWNNFGKQQIHRTECTCNWDRFQRWHEHLLKDTNTPEKWKFPLRDTDKVLSGTVLSLIFDTEYKLRLFDYLSSTTVYFVDKRSKEKITILDLLQGYQPIKS